MDFRQNVTDKDDFERLSPTPEQLQHDDDDELFPGLGVTSAPEDHFPVPDYDYGFGATDMTYPSPDLHDEAQGMPTTHTSQMYDGIMIPVADAPGNDASAYGFGDGSDVAVTSFEDPTLFNMLGNLEAPDVAQTTFDATEDPTETHLHQSNSLFESGNQNDYPLPNFAYNTHAAATTNFVPAPTSLSRTYLSPTMNNFTPQASLPAGFGSPPVNYIDRSRKRRATSSASRDTPEASRLKKQCAGCEKAFYTSKDPDGLRCTRCHDKHVKHTAGHTVYRFDPTMTLDTAWHHLYPPVKPMAIVGDDVEAGKENEQSFVHRLVDAVSTPYISDGSGSKEDAQRMAQQAKLNKKPFDSTQYRDELVNARIRFLFVSHPFNTCDMWTAANTHSSTLQSATMLAVHPSTTLAVTTPAMARIEP